MKTQMGFGLNKNIIPMDTESIMKTQMVIGINENMIPMEIESTLKTQMVIFKIIDQTQLATVRL